MSNRNLGHPVMQGNGRTLVIAHVRDVALHQSKSKCWRNEGKEVGMISSQSGTREMMREQAKVLLYSYDMSLRTQS